MLVNHVLIYSLGRLAPALINFLAIAAYTRLVMPDDYGIYILGTSTASFLCTTLCLWMRQSVVRFIPQQPDQREKIIGTFLGLLVIQLIAVGAIGFGIGLAMDVWHERQFVIIVTVLLMAQSWCESTTELLRVDLNPQKYSTTYLIRALLSPIIVLTLILVFHMRGQAMIAGLAIAWAVTPLYHIRSYWKWSQIGVDFGWLKKFFKYGFPMTIAAGLQLLTTAADRWIIAHISGVAAAGLYGVGADLARQALSAFMQTINLAALPLALAKMKDGDEAAARYQLKQNLNMQTLVILPALVGMVVLTPNIVEVVLGEAFRATAIDVLPLVAIAIFMSGLSTFYFDQAFEFGLSTNTMIPKSLVVAVISIALNFVLIPDYGLIGAAYTMLVASAVGLVLSIILGRRFFRLDVDWQAQIRIFLAAVLMALVLWPLRDHRGVLWLMVQVGAGGLVYGIVALALDAGRCRELVFESFGKLRRKGKA